MTTQLNIAKDANGFPTGSINFSDTIYSITAAANTVYHLAVAPDSVYAIFSFVSAAGVWVKRDNAAATSISLPIDAFAEDGLELNPSVRTVAYGQYLHFIASQPAEISIAFYNNKTF